MTVLQTLREFHAQDIATVRMDALARLSGLTQYAVDREVIALKKQGLLLVDSGYATLAAPPSTAHDDDEYTKQCSVCRKTKAKREFQEQITNKDGLSGRCRACINERRAENRKGRPKADRPRRICKTCHQRLDLQRNFSQVSDNPFRFSTSCIACEAKEGAERHCTYCGGEFTTRVGHDACGSCRLELSMLNAKREAACGVSP